MSLRVHVCILFYSGHLLNISLHGHVLTVRVLASFLHPDLKDSCDTHHDSKEGDDDRVEDIPMNWQLELIVKHGDSE